MYELGRRIVQIRVHTADSRQLAIHVMEDATLRQANAAIADALTLTPTLLPNPSPKPQPKPAPKCGSWLLLVLRSEFELSIY